MEGTIATASRDIVGIKKRKVSYYAYRGLQEIARLRWDRDEARTALLYPKIGTQDVLVDLLNRLAWYLPERTLPDDCEVLLSVADGLDVAAALDDAPAAQGSYVGNHLPLRLVDGPDLERSAGEADLLLVWDAAARTSVPALRNFSKVEFVDPAYWSGTESYTWGIVGDALLDGGGDRSAERFRALEEKAQGYARSYVFATGPSLDDAMDLEFEADSLKVVCNSIVRNEAMLEHIDPDVLVFGDQVFHFGPSRYAATFRADAIDAMDAYGCVGVIPAQYGGLVAGHYPETPFVSMPKPKLSEPHFPTSDELWVRDTDNIMTLFMLPIASALTDEVNVLGADGREEGESYFWEHNESAQYDDEMMKTAVDCHPSFFRDRVYSDYYDEHVSTLETMIEYGESRGVSYRNLTHSYIPCLAERSVDDPREHVGEDS